MKVSKVLVTGGCGYIGSHVVRLLSEHACKPVVVDNLSTGFPEALIHGETLERVDCRDGEGLRRVLRTHKIEAVIHFAASIVVPESVRAPLDYYANNTGAFVTLLAACVDSGVRQVIFSSTAAVYATSQALIHERSPTNPSSPYGSSKLMSERILQDAALAHDLKFVILRYFNVAGADPLGRMGQRTRNATHLIKVALQAVLGARSEVTVFGSDYETPDGTGVRDYIHVEDLASAHLAALAYLEAGGSSVILNCGYGRGSSVLDVLGAVRAVTGREVPAVMGPRRPGDPARMVADAGALRQTLDWSPKYEELRTIVEHAYRWEQLLGKA